MKYLIDADPNRHSNSEEEIVLHGRSMNHVDVLACNLLLKEKQIRDGFLAKADEDVRIALNAAILEIERLGEGAPRRLLDEWEASRQPAARRPGT